jgi:hypothetical protein
MVSTVFNAKVVSTNKSDRRHENERRCQEPHCIVQYHEYKKGVSRIHQYLSRYSMLRKTVKCLKKVVLYLINCAVFNVFCFLCL